MAKERGKHGENDREGYDYQLCCLLHCVLQIKDYPSSRIKKYEIGSAIEGYGAMDDVVIKVTFIDEQNTEIVKIYGIQVKHIKNNKMIDETYMCDNSDTYMAKYFKSFVDFDNRDQLEQVVIWSNMDFAKNVRDWFVSYPEAQEFDLLGEGYSKMSYQRHQFTKKKRDEFKEEFHPRTVLIKLLIDKMLTKKVWSVKDAAKDNYYSVMAQEIFEWKGDKPQFRQQFIDNKNLSNEAQDFRKGFERIMKRRFETRKFGEFSMEQLNATCDKPRFELKIDTLFKDEKCMKEEWKEWTEVPLDKDVNEFFKRFVFYTKVPNSKQLKNFIGQRLQDRNLCSYEQWYTLIEESAFKKLINETQINKLLKLVGLRRGMDCGPYLQLQFENFNDLKMVDAFLNGKNKTFLCIKASQNVACSLSRLVYVVERMLDRINKRYLVMNYETHNKKDTLIKAILKDPKLACVIITCKSCIPMDKMDEIFKKLSSVKLICVGKEFGEEFKTIDDSGEVVSVDEEITKKFELTSMKQWVGTFFNEENRAYLCIKAFQHFSWTISRLVFVVEEELKLIKKQYEVLSYETIIENLTELEAILNYPSLVCVIITCRTSVSKNKLDEICNKLSALKLLFVGKEFDEELEIMNDKLDVVDEQVTEKFEVAHLNELVGTLFRGDNKTLCIKATKSFSGTVCRLVYIVEEELKLNGQQCAVLNFQTIVKKLTYCETILNNPSLVCVIITCKTCVTKNKLDEISNKLSALKLIFVGNEFEGGLKTTDDQVGLVSVYEKVTNMFEMTQIKESVHTLLSGGNTTFCLCSKTMKTLGFTLSRLVYVVAKESELNDKIYDASRAVDNETNNKTKDFDRNKNQYVLLNYETDDQNFAELKGDELKKIGLMCVIVVCRNCISLEKMNDITNKLSPLKVIFVGKQFAGESTVIDDKFDEESINEDTKKKMELQNIELTYGSFFNRKNKPLLCIKAMQNVDCTLSRLIHVVRGKLEPHPARYLAFNFETYQRKLAELEEILEDPELISIGLECIIITCVPPNKINEISEKLSAVTVMVVNNEFDMRFTTIDDKFDVGSISESWKTKIKNIKIKLLPKQCVTVKDIFGDDLFTQDCHPIILELFKIEDNKPIELLTSTLEKDPHYRRRLTKNITINGKIVQLDLLEQVINTLNVSVESEKLYRFIVSNEPGMGKSTELNRIACGLREKLHSHLTVRLDCKTVAYNWRGNVSKSVCESLTSNIDIEFTISLVEKMMQHERVIWLMDGYDEVSSANKSKLDAFLTEVSKNEKYKSVILFIATRPHCLNDLKKEITNGIVCHLNPFSEGDQEEYLKSFWEVEKNNNDEEKRTIMENTREIIATFRAIVRKNQSIIGIPLQTYMIAYIYKDAVKDKTFQVPKPHEIGSIYEKFVELKFEEYYKRELSVSTAQEQSRKGELEAFVPYHAEIAHAVYTRIKPNELKVKCDRFQYIGLIQLSPSIEFAHLTYFEYFITLYFLQYRTDKNKEFVAFMKQYFCNSQMDLATKFLDYHIGKIKPEIELKSIPSGSKSAAIFPVDFIPPLSARLHKDKVREFHLYLSDDCSEKDRYTLIRQCFNISVFNVLEVLYDSFPSNSEKKLRFHFGAKENHVNLKPSGESQVLHLLNLLWKKHPANFVRLYLTAFDDDEEDFIEVVCRKPFVKICKWLTTELVPKLSKEERDALEAYVTRRLGKYIELVVQHNNARLMEQVIDWVEINCSTEVETETVKHFLHNNSVMLHFVTNVEIKAKNKPFNVDSRVKMVKILYDLFVWTFGNQTLSDAKYIDIVINIKTPDIKDAFDKTFLLAR